MAALKPYREKLNEQLLTKKPSFLQLLISVYQKRLKEADSIIDNVCKQPFRFTDNEKLTIAEITGYPRNTIEQRIKWYKIIKASTLAQLIEFDKDLLSTSPVARKKSIDSL